tara:strand:+ start:1731 stop:3515 length:1785 start_codon:yes stop_codon:yes gene_type:complete
MAGYLGSVPVPQATQHRESFTCTEGQTSFATAGYTPQFLDVYLNGSHLSPADFTATNGSDVVLGVAASADDVCDIISYTPFEVADQTFTGVISFADGSASAPSITNTGDINTGIFFPAADTIGFAEGGEEAARFDSSGRFLLGHTSAVPISTNNMALQTVGTGFTTSGVLQSRFEASASGPSLLFAHSRGSVGAHAILEDGDEFGKIRFYGSDGNDFVNFGAHIVAAVDGTPGNNDMPGRIVFGTTADGAASPTERLRIDSAGNIGISNGSYIGTLSSAHAITVQGGAGAPGGSIRYGGGTGDNDLRFSTDGSERLRINGSGNLLFGDNLNTSAATNDVAGVTVGKTGNIQASVSGNPCLFVNRKTNDGTIVSIRQAGSEEGTISVSGSTVSYNAFSGSHWSRLTDNSKPTILKGTLIETIDEMCDWYQAQFTIPATTKVNEDGDTVEDVAAYTVKEPIALPNGASVGDTISHISNDVTYSATIVKENDNKHTKCKISDTADSLRVYGVFAAWDGDDDTVNDMYVTAVGTHVVRIHGGQTVSAGDLLVSNGDGTAKVQDDDIIRSKTLGKVLTNIKQETYADNSYTVPCALYCG